MKTVTHDRMVRIIRPMPGHPKGCVRTPSPELFKRWLRTGYAEVLEPREKLQLPKKKHAGKKKAVA